MTMLLKWAEDYVKRFEDSVKPTGGIAVTGDVRLELYNLAKSIIEEHKGKEL